MSIRRLPAGTVGALVAVLAGAAIVSADELVTVGQEVQLFVDDYVVASMTDVTRQVVPPAKHPANPVMRPDRPWEGPNVLPTTVRYDAGQNLFRMWYRPGTGKFRSAYATSRDGVDWEKPALGQVEFAGSRENNQLDVSTGPAWNGVIDDVRETDPARRFKLLSYRKASRSAGLYLYVSPDGLRWTPHSDEPLLEGLADVHTLMGWDETIQRYVAFVRPDLGGLRTIARTTSPDMVRWTEPEIVLKPDEFDPPGTHLYGMSVYHDRGVYFGLLWVYHPNRLMVDAQLAFSRDGVQWERVGRRHPILSTGLPNAFDSHIVMPLEPLLVGDELRIYYLAKDRPHPIVYPSEVQPMLPTPLPESEQTWLEGRRSYCGLATMRRDRFVSLYARLGGGEIVTKPFKLEGRELRLNADAGKGDVRVELLDDAGKAIPKFGLADADVIRGDATAHTVSWRGNHDLSRLVGRTVRLRMKVRNAHLFSFQVVGK